VGGYEKAFRAGLPETGVTVHLVDEGVDSGPICAQERFGIKAYGTPAEVERAGLAIENRLYPETLKWLLTEQVRIEELSGGGKVCVPTGGIQC
jgi:phosphoribosylglycinamide formyltransferase-1